MFLLLVYFPYKKQQLINHIPSNKNKTRVLGTVLYIDKIYMTKKIVKYILTAEKKMQADFFCPKIYIDTMDTSFYDQDIMVCKSKI